MTAALASDMSKFQHKCMILIVCPRTISDCLYTSFFLLLDPSISAGSGSNVGFQCDSSGSSCTLTKFDTQAGAYSLCLYTGITNSQQTHMIV